MKIKTKDLTGAALDWATAIVFNPAPEWGKWNPSINWAQGGPIIEHESIEIHQVTSGRWSARWWANNSGMAKNPSQKFKHNIYVDGPTPLIAAMRCYVASKLGDEINLPDDLALDCLIYETGDE